MVEYYIMWTLQYYLWMSIVDNSILITVKNNYEGIMRVNFIYKILVLIPVSVIYFSSLHCCTVHVVSISSLLFQLMQFTTL
jgi:hypothetical protein